MKARVVKCLSFLLFYDKVRNKMEKTHKQLGIEGPCLL